jgi:hypothetical protein
MLPNQFAGIKKTMGAAADMISLVASDDRGHALFFTDTRVSHRYDPAWFSARTSWRAFPHSNSGVNKSVRATAIANLRFLRKYSL